MEGGVTGGRWGEERIAGRGAGRGRGRASLNSFHIILTSQNLLDISGRCTLHYVQDCRSTDKL